MFDVVVLAVFILLQIADGILTYWGVVYSPLGIRYEVNPILASSFYWFESSAIVLMVAKGLSIAASIFLYCARDRMAFGVRTIRHLQLLTVMMIVIFVMHIMTLFSMLAQTLTG